MPQVTLSVPQEKHTVLQPIFQAFGIERFDFQSLFTRKNKTKTISSTSEKNVAVSWEYFSNELEFE